MRLNLVKLDLATNRKTVRGLTNYLDNFTLEKPSGENFSFLFVAELEVAKMSNPKAF